MYKGKEPLREGTQRGGTSRPIYGRTPSLAVDDSRRQRLADGSEISELNARRPKGNAPGGRGALLLWEKQRGEIWRREADTRKRVEERKRREADKWDAEVAQFGEEEAIRRRDLEKYAARLADEFPTSDIEEMDIADERANPLLYINAVLRVDKKPQWAHFVGRHHLWGVDVALMICSSNPSGM